MSNLRNPMKLKSFTHHHNTHEIVTACCGRFLDRHTNWRSESFTYKTQAV